MAQPGTAVAPDEVPLWDPDFSTGDPYASLARLRAEAPVYRCNTPGGPMWALTKHADVLAVSKDPATFQSGKGILIDDLRRTVVGNESIIYLDPPEHVRHRKLVSGWFRPRTVAAMEETIRRQTRALLDALPIGERVDIHEELAVRLPIAVMADLLGVPESDHAQFRAWSDRIIDDGSGQKGMEDDITLGMVRIYEYFGAFLQERRANPGNDIVSDIVNVQIDGERLTDHDVLAFCVTLLVAGNETSRNLAAGGIVELAAAPEQWRAVLDDRSLVPSLVEELLRFVSPVMHFCRVATRPTQLRGIPIAEGDMVAMFYNAANRDEEVFGDDAEVLDVRRDPNPHLAFGFGEHFCLGAQLARLEARVLFDEIVARSWSIQLDGEPQRKRSNLMRGFHSIPAVVTAG